MKVLIKGYIADSHVIKPLCFGDEEKYSCTIAAEGEELALLNQKTQLEFGNKYMVSVRSDPNVEPFLYVRAKTQFKPQVYGLDSVKQKKFELTEEPKTGTYCVFELNVYSYIYAGNKGAACNIVSLLALSDATPAAISDIYGSSLLDEYIKTL